MVGPHRRRPRRGRVKAGLAIVLVTVVAVVGATLLTRPADDSAASSALRLTGPQSTSLQEALPWPVPADTATAVRQAGLALGPMGTAEHYHAHLDVLVNGRAVAVPGNIGVDQFTGEMSALHTHPPDGIVHVEAARRGQIFTLGQFFTQWGVSLATDRIGGLRTGDGKTLAVYANGVRVEGNPRDLRFAPRQQVTIVYGSPDQQVDVPATYDFPPGS